ncbi:MAG TPA: hypothetical protein VGS80_14235, partial [Ktedonobacterales bacterium]|nr:hypothetical protein [Ktedonobacterales bacterium]
IQYFNFYGDINVVVSKNILGYHLPLGVVGIGDLVMLPGQNDPQKATYWGGSRVCLNCHGTEQYETNGSNFQQWGFASVYNVDLGRIINGIASQRTDIPTWCRIFSDVSSGASICNAPMMHIRVYLDPTQYPFSSDPNAPLLLALDSSGRFLCSGQNLSQTNSPTISYEIVCQLEKGDGFQ